MEKFLVILVSFLISLMFAGSALAHMVSVVSPQNVLINDTFTVNITINTTANVMGIATDIKFDNTKLEALSPVEEGELIKQCSNRTFYTVQPKINNYAGEINFVDMCMCNTSVNGNGSVAVIKFKAIALGISDISLQKTYLYDSNADRIMSGVEINSGKVMINGDKCDLNNDGIIIQDYNDLMADYKCFIGAGNNCGWITHNDWKNIKEKYECFVGINQ